MPLTLYRRHQKGCEAGHPVDQRTTEFEERKRGFQKCGCFIFAAGSLNKLYRRKYTSCVDWAAAREIATRWEASGSWDTVPQPAQPQPPAPPSRITIEEAIKAFMAERAEVSSQNTIRKHRYLLKSLQTYANDKGYIHPDQWQPTDVRQLRASWEVAPITGSKNMETVKAFFRFCAANKWIEESPATEVRPVKGKHENPKERLPFSDDEISKMFSACRDLYGKTPIKWNRDVHHRAATTQTANYRYKWNGGDLADFIDLAIHTGLRISDLCLFHVSRLQPNGECHIRTTKTGRKVFTWIPPALQERIRERAAIHGPLIFGSHQTTDINVITDVWRRKLNRLWELCGPWPEKPTPHRLRHTFARILLQKPGVTIRDVAELLGDSEAMVLKHYAAFVPERQERLTRILQEAFADKPKPGKIVSIR